jgi:hypothetical protein
MWEPRSERDILSAIDAGGLVETANFDAKLALPGKGKSKDLAVDVAVMSADGGTLLYGVAEDGTAGQRCRRRSGSPEPASAWIR